MGAVQQTTFLEQDPAARRQDDFYATPAWQTRALLARLRPFSSLERVIEPAAGDGAIVRELTAQSVTVVTNDIVVREPMLPDFLLDARQRATWSAFAQAGRIDYVLTNLPFDVSFEIAQHAYEYANLAVILLLRLSWLEPTEDRGPWLCGHPPTSVIVMPRHDYRGNGATDSVTSAWMVWEKQASRRHDNGPLCRPGLDVVTREERDRLVGVIRREQLA